jgi:LysR family nitrogen assimilation transcriptional regulator
MRKALEGRLGCAILARSTVGDELAAKKVHARRIIEPTLNRTLSLISLTDHPQTRAFIEIRELLIRVILDAVQNGIWPAKETLGKRGRLGSAR